MKRLAYLLLFVVLPLSGMLGCGADSTLTGSQLRDQANRQANTNLQASDNQTYAHLSGQSGIYAGDDGYQIINRSETHLKGGIITATQSAEDSGQNLFITDTLKLEHLENKSHHDGFAFNISGGYSEDGNSSASFGHSHERERENGTTHASINTRNLVILDRAAQETLTGRPLEETLSEANQGIWTDTAVQHSGAVNNRLKGEQGLDSVVTISPTTSR